MKIKNKKAMEGGTWWIIMGAIVAILVAGIVIYIVKGGLFAGRESVDLLGSCQGQGGECYINPCKKDYFESKGFRGCGSGKYKATPYCCIPRET